MESKMNLMIDAQFKTKSARDRFIHQINNDTDIQFTVHGENGIPNSQSVKLYNVSRIDLLELSAILFAVDVEEDISIVQSIDDQPTPKRIDK